MPAPPQQRGPQHPPPQPASAQPGRKPERTKKGEAAGDAESFPQPARTKGPPPVGDTALAHVPVTHRGWHRAGWWPQQTVHSPPRPHLLCAHGESSPRHISLLPPETTGAAGRGAGQAAFGVILSFPPHRLPPHARAQPGMHQIGFSISSCKCAENISKRATRGSSCPLCLSSGCGGEGKRGAGR